MKPFRTGAVRAVVLVVAMLAAIGAWEISKGAVLKAQGGVGPCGGEGQPSCPVADHLVCYKIHHQEHSDAGRRFEAVVRLENQFETSVAKIKDHEKLLCVPTVKTLLSLTEKDHDDDSHGGRK